MTELAKHFGQHIPVLHEETVAALEVCEGGFVVDCTYGRGGHARAILQRLGPTGRLIAFDRDPVAVASASTLARADSRLEMIPHAFSELFTALDERRLVGRIDAILFDLGVSSPQLDDPKRGFSFSADGPLDMRMNPNEGVSAAQWVNEVAEGELADTLYQLGDERDSRRIARAIVRRRAQTAFETTLDLARVIASAVRRRTPGRHPATRSFQAIRIFINHELNELKEGLEAALRVLKPGGRLAVISFHSLEDRIVKRFMRENSRGPELPRGLPPPIDMPNPPLAKVLKAVKPSDTELNANPRARSAVLRVAEMAA